METSIHKVNSKETGIAKKIKLEVKKTKLRIPANIKTMLPDTLTEDNQSPDLRLNHSPKIKMHSPHNDLRITPSEISLNKIRKINVLKLQEEESTRAKVFTDANVTQYREKNASQMSQYEKR